jgi:hypothetical protein
MNNSMPDDRLPFVPFQLATLAPEPVEGDDWLHEIKFDGYRMQLIVQNHAAREGNGLATAMLPPGGRDDPGFKIIVVGKRNSDPLSAT